MERALESGQMENSNAPLKSHKTSLNVGFAQTILMSIIPKPLSDPTLRPPPRPPLGEGGGVLQNYVQGVRGGKGGGVSQVNAALSAIGRYRGV